MLADDRRTPLALSQSKSRIGQHILASAGLALLTDALGQSLLD